MIEEKKEGALLHRENSPTASTVGDQKFGPSGVQTYRVLVAAAMGGTTYVDVDAATGDEAAAKALDKYPGAKVGNVTPAPKAD